MVNFLSLMVLYTLICQVSFLRSQSLEYITDGSEPDYTTDLVDGELDHILKRRNSKENTNKFLVHLYYEGKYRCLGSLISDRLILTALHCVTYDDELQNPVLICGHADGEKGCIIQHNPIEFESIHVLPKGDLAILVTKKIVDFGDGVGRICLSNDTTKDLMYQDALAATVGTESSHNGAVKFSPVKLVNKSRCSIQGISKICVYGENTTLCKGDSGGPLIVANKKDGNLLIGVLLHAATRDGQTHEGKECSNLVVYDRVSYYSKFISEVAKRSNSNVCFIPS